MLKNKRKIPLVLLAIGLALTPVYAFSSGGMQPAHLIFALLMLFAFGKNNIEFTKLSRLLLFLFVYTIFVELFYGVIHSSVDQLINPLFILFNLLLFTTVYIVINEYDLAAVRLGLFVATAIALISVLVSGVDLYGLQDEERPVGTFNNPNQLGYFSTCVLSIAYLLRHHGYLNYLQALLLFLAALALSIFSLSKAAMIANMAVILFAVAPKTRSGFVLFILFMLPVVAYALYQTLEAGTLDNFLFFRRIDSMMDENDSSLSERGYFAFLEGNPLQILLGMGSENINKIVGHEVHSTFGSMLNYYGILGFILFVGIYWHWARSLYLAYGAVDAALILSPPTLYGIMHNGMRFTIFWFLVAISYAMAQKTLRASTLNGRRA